MADAGEMLLAAIEALHAEVRANTAELRSMREEARADRQASGELERMRKAAREKKARQRASRDCPGTEPIKEPAKPSQEAACPGDFPGTCPGTVPGTPQVLKALVVDLDLKTTRTRTKNLSRPGDVPGTGDSPETEAERPTVATRKAYVAAYQIRWGTEPLINKKANGILKQFVDLVGREAAPEVATFYLSHNQALYVNAKHPIVLLMRDASKLHTEWKTNSPSTWTEARIEERSQANLNGWSKHLSTAKGSG